MRLLPHYDILYARDFPAAIIALLPRLVFKRKLVLEMNGIAHEEQRLRSESILSRMFSVGIQKAEKMAPQYSNRIVSVTTQIASYLIGNFNCRPEKIKVITNGVNTEEFRPILDVNLLGNLRSRLGIDREERVVAFVGNLAPWQGVEYLIGAAPMLLKKNQGTRFLIVGGGPLKDALMAETNRLAISNYFVFTGMVDHEEIPLYINLADICVLPKRRLKSGYSPIKLYEYMACGKPVVASRVEGLIFLEEEGAGLLVEPENVDDLEKALDDLLQDPGKRASMGSTGLKIAVERYSWKSKAIEIEGVLRDLM
jgi:glycosyltransferase involved in cell wall biosynthesis